MLKYILHCILLITAISLVACNRKATLDQLFNATPYEKYLKSLSQADLDKTALGKDWLQAGTLSLEDSLVIDLPYQEVGYFTTDQPSALFLRYHVWEGQQISIALEALSQPEATYFMDVFEVAADSTFLPRYAADTSMTIQYEVEKSGWHAVRIQPELLRGGPYSFNITFQPSLSFPVSGMTSKAVGSFFGDPRDGGVRSHKGVDIFAPKGTPVVAASPGVVGRKTNSKLGGKVVWLNSLKKGFTQYYAHLDSQAVRPGQRVEVGDTLGFVGNTGNARYTPPHLHFSIYKYGRGAVDPYPFVQQVLEEMPVVEADSSQQIGIPARVKSSRANVRYSPTTKSDIIASFPLHTLVDIHGKTNRWYRIALPNGQPGFIHDSLIEAVEQPLQEVLLTQADTLYTDAQKTQSMSGALIAGNAAVIAAFDSLWYVQTQKGFYGWLEQQQVL